MYFITFNTFLCKNEIRIVRKKWKMGMGFLQNELTVLLMCFTRVVSSFNAEGCDVRRDLHNWNKHEIEYEEKE